MSEPIVLASPFAEEEQQGRPYEVTLELPIGSFTFRWWPMVRRPEEAMAEWGQQVRGYNRHQVGQLFAEANRVLIETAYAALQREATPMLTLDGPGSERVEKEG